MKKGSLRVKKRKFKNLALCLSCSCTGVEQTSLWQKNVDNEIKKLIIRDSDWFNKSIRRQNLN